MAAIAPSTASGTCTPAQRVTKSLLGYGVVAGPFYVAVTLAQALTREGFDLTRHQWSLLANGSLGWIQITNFLLTGLMTIAFAVGLARVLGPDSTWAPRLVAFYGAGLLGAAVFRADPAQGFPAGTPAGPGTVSWHGLLHLVCGAVGFTGLAVACFLLAGHFARHAAGGWAVWSRATGVLFLRIRSSAPAAAGGRRCCGSRRGSWRTDEGSRSAGRAPRRR